MKIQNISKEEQRVYPRVGGPFSCAPSGDVDVDDACAVELLESFPSIWRAADIKPQKSKKAGDK